MDIYPPSGATGVAETITARLLTRARAVWPTVTPIGSAQVLEPPLDYYPAQAGVAAAASPSGFGGLTINSDWDWAYGPLTETLDALVNSQWSPSSPTYYFVNQGGEPVDSGTWTPQDVEERGRVLFGLSNVLTASGGPGIDVDAASVVSVDLAATPGLKFDAMGNAGKLLVKVDANRALTLTADGVGLPAGGAKYDVAYVNAAGNWTVGTLKLKA